MTWQARIASLQAQLAAAAAGGELDAAAMETLLYGEDRSVREEVFRFLKTDPLFKIDFNHTKEALRQITRARLQKVVNAGYIALRGTPEQLCALALLLVGRG